VNVSVTYKHEIAEMFRLCRDMKERTVSVIYKRRYFGNDMI
jgi:hypothetical protein